MKDMIHALSVLVEEQRLKAQALEGIDSWFKDSDGEIDGWSRNQVEAEFVSHALLFEHINFSYPLIETYFELQNKLGKRIGHYRLYTTLPGDADDAYMVIEKSNKEKLAE